MLRLTTNVTVSPASSARSSSAAWRMSSIASGRVSANSAVSSSGASGGPSRARSIAPGHEVAADRRGRLGAPRAAARDEAPVARADRVEDRLGQPLRVDVARVHAQALGQREAVLLQAPAHLVDARGTGARGRCGRRWPTARRGRWRRPRTSCSHQSARFGRDLHAHVGHQLARRGRPAPPSPPRSPAWPTPEAAPPRAPSATPVCQ